MLDLQQQGALRYEERVRLERANGLREAELTCESCVPQCKGVDESYMEGMTYADLAKTPLRQNQVCPHPKVIVPVHPSFVVTDEVKEIKAKYNDPVTRLVDVDRCDARVQGSVLNTLGKGDVGEVKHTSTIVTHTTRVEDTFWDLPTEVKVVTQDVDTDTTPVVQPMKTTDTEAVDSVTADGKKKSKKAPEAPVAEAAPAGNQPVEPAVNV